MTNAVHSIGASPDVELGRSTAPSSFAGNCNVRLSEILWQRDWLDRLPITLSGSNLIADRCSIEEAAGFIREHFPELTEERYAGTPSAQSVQEAKARYIALSDAFAIRDQDRMVAAFVGAPEDWSTYYCRVFAILPQSRRPRLTLKIAEEVLFPGLADVGVERIEAETSPVNRAMTNFFLASGFCVTGQRVTERWGALVRYTKFLRSAEFGSFAERFSAVAPKAIGPRPIPQTKERRI